MAWLQKKEGRFFPTELGKRVNHLLVQSFPDILNVEFTAQMEEKINQLTREQADEIMNPHKGENQSREQATFDLLNQYLG